MSLEHDGQPAHHPTADSCSSHTEHDCLAFSGGEPIGLAIIQ